MPAATPMPACAPTLNPVLLLDEEESLVAVSVTSVLAGLNDTELVVEVVVLLVGELVGELVVVLVVVDEMSAPSVTWLRWLNS